jgi:hypothetical protein
LAHLFSPEEQMFIAFRYVTKLALHMSAMCKHTCLSLLRSEALFSGPRL